MFILFSIVCITFLFDNIYYTTISDSEVRTGTEDTSKDYNAIQTSVGTLNIPKVVTYNSKKYTVTTIGVKSFRRCNFTSIKIPTTIYEICDYGFDVNNIVEWPSLPYLKHIGYLGFASNLFEKITLLKNIVTISPAAFAYNIKLEHSYIIDSNYFFADIPGYLYNSDMSRLIWISTTVKTVNILPSVTELEPFLLTYITDDILLIPQLCRKIGYHSIFGCKYLKKFFLQEIFIV